MTVILVASRRVLISANRQSVTSSTEVLISARIETKLKLVLSSAVMLLQLLPTSFQRRPLTVGESLGQPL